MSIGVSTACFYPDLTENALEFLGKSGIKTIEIFFNSSSEVTPEFLTKIKQTLQVYGMNVTTVHPYTSGFEPFLLFSEYKRRFEDGLAYYRRFFETANRLSAKYVILHGEKLDGVISETEYFSRFATLSDIASGFGVTLLQENINCFRSQNPDFIRRMKSALPDHAKFVLDLKQAVRAGFSPYELADAMGDRLFHVHISDHTKAQSCLLPGDGEFEFSDFFRYLTGLDKPIDCIIEVYRSAYSYKEQIVDCWKILSQSDSI